MFLVRMIGAEHIEMNLIVMISIISVNVITNLRSSFKNLPNFLQLFHSFVHSKILHSYFGQLFLRICVLPIVWVFSQMRGMTLKKHKMNLFYYPWYFH